MLPIGPLGLKKTVEYVESLGLPKSSSGGMGEQDVLHEMSWLLNQEDVSVAMWGGLAEYDRMDTQYPELFEPLKFLRVGGTVMRVISRRIDANMEFIERFEETVACCYFAQQGFVDAIDDGTVVANREDDHLVQCLEDSIASYIEFLAEHAMAQSVKSLPEDNAHFVDKENVDLRDPGTPRSVMTRGGVGGAVFDLGAAYAGARLAAYLTQWIQESIAAVALKTGIGGAATALTFSAASAAWRMMSKKQHSKQEKKQGPVVPPPVLDVGALSHMSDSQKERTINAHNEALKAWTYGHREHVTPGQAQKALLGAFTRRRMSTMAWAFATGFASQAGWSAVGHLAKMQAVQIFQTIPDAGVIKEGVLLDIYATDKLNELWEKKDAILQKITQYIGDGKTLDSTTTLGDDGLFFVNNVRFRQALTSMAAGSEYNIDDLIAYVGSVHMLERAEDWMRSVTNGAPSFWGIVERNTKRDASITDKALLWAASLVFGSMTLVPLWKLVEWTGGKVAAIRRNLPLIPSPFSEEVGKIAREQNLPPKFIELLLILIGTEPRTNTDQVNTEAAQDELYNKFLQVVSPGVADGTFLGAVRSVLSQSPQESWANPPEPEPWQSTGWTQELVAGKPATWKQVAELRIQDAVVIHNRMQPSLAKRLVPKNWKLWYLSRMRSVLGGILQVYERAFWPYRQEGKVVGMKRTEHAYVPTAIGGQANLNNTLLYGIPASGFTWDGKMSVQEGFNAADIPGTPPASGERDAGNPQERAGTGRARPRPAVSPARRPHTSAPVVDEVFVKFGLGRLTLGA